ncbi:MAG: PorP/SprF family type IX secretion system membrane protein [Bacteroidales bacterium]|jgi:type IX secretion system PorP/SprF family membrane protein|nr:PorP/SprF family type IX secretion system membrane protein [Bacteroidales bacterium]
MKKVFVIIISVWTIHTAFAQQFSANTLYDWNKIVRNPAFAGTSNTTDISFQMRQQWLGFEDSPRNQYITTQSLLKNGIGIGGVLFNNSTGPTKQTGLKAAFAKHLKLTSDTWLSLSLSFDIYQNYYDKSRLHTGLPNDPAIEESLFGQKLAPDASFGAVYFSDYYYAGFSISNITESKYDLFTTNSDFSNPISRTYFLMAGYSLEIDEEFFYNPSCVLTKTGGLPMEFDMAHKVYYKSLIGGISYRSNNDVSLILGAHFAEFYEIVYAYDYAINTLGEYSTGNHEVVLKFAIPNTNKNKGKEGRRMDVLW